jgi:hypothetical protein
MGHNKALEPHVKAAALTMDNLKEPEEKPALFQLGQQVEGRKIKGAEVSVPLVP